jgi:hypothetical protein
MIGEDRLNLEMVRGEEAAADEVSTFRAPYLILDEFLPRRDATFMRQQIDDHFAEPHKQRPDIHQIWNYWYVPGLYTYLRTLPEKVIERELIARFHQALSVWAEYVLGMRHVTWPLLSMYVDGCGQSLHNDSTNGRFGFVYSLTWDDRKTIGGETIVLNEGDLFRSNMGRSAAGPGLFQLIEPRFNRLTIFDDRMPHGVQRVEGPMDPIEARFVLHGHISENGPHGEGGLPADEVAAYVHAAVAPLARDLNHRSTLYHGPLVLRLAIEPTGEVARVDVLVDRVARADGGRTAEEMERVIATVRGMRFPEAAMATETTVPLLFGGDLPWMSPARR